MEEKSIIDQIVKNYLAIERVAQPNQTKDGLREELNEQEEQYIEYLEERQRNSQIIGKQSAASAQFQDDMSSLGEMNSSRLNKDELRQNQGNKSELKKDMNVQLIEQKRLQQQNFLNMQKGLSGEVKAFIVSLQEENQLLVAANAEKEGKYKVRNRQIQLLIHEIEACKRDDKYFQSVVQGNKLPITDPILRIEKIEQTKSKNTITLPKMNRQEEIVPQPSNYFDFWKHESVSEAFENMQKKQTKFKCLKDIIQNEQLWVIEKERGKKQQVSRFPSIQYGLLNDIPFPPQKKLFQVQNGQEQKGNEANYRTNNKIKSQIMQQNSLSPANSIQQFRSPTNKNGELESIWHEKIS